MSAAIIAAFWAYAPTMKDGFVLPKIAAVAAGMVLYLLRDRPRAIAFLLVCALSAWRSVVPEWSWLGLPSFWTYGVVSAACYCLLTTMPTRWNWLKWAGVALSIHAVAQKFGLDPLVAVSKLPAGRAVAFIGSPIDLGAILAMAAPAAGWWLPAIMAGLWACGSRGAWLAVAFVFAPKGWRLLLLPILLAPIFSSQPKDIARVEIWRIAWQGFKERPWLGNGPNTYRLVFEQKKTKRLVDAVGNIYAQQQAHSDILEALCSVGLLGLAAYLFLVWPLLRHPSLMALFIVAKNNPVSFEVLCAAALIAANEIEKEEHQWRTK